jgi:hypothetical protein
MPDKTLRTTAAMPGSSGLMEDTTLWLQARARCSTLRPDLIGTTEDGQSRHGGMPEPGR